MSEKKRKELLDWVTLSPGGRFRSIEEVPDEEDQENIREYDRLRLEEYIEGKRHHIKEMKGGLARFTTLGPPGSNSGLQNMMSALLTDKRTQEQWLGLTGNQRQTILESVNMISAANA